MKRRIGRHAGGREPVGPVHRARVIRFIVMLVLAVAAALWFTRDEPPPPPPKKSAAITLLSEPARSSQPDSDEPGAAPPRLPVAGRHTATLSSAEKAARIERIRQDYGEIRARVSAEYSATGPGFPGGLNAFLRQLALLEREKRDDFATFLSAGELEELELRETTAGLLVQRLLGDTAATDEQRRAVFRLQREFEDRFALTFDLSSQGLLQRESMRQATQERIRFALGDDLFTHWVRGEGPEFEHFRAFALRHGLAADVPLQLWRAKNEFTLRQLELAAQRPMPGEPLRAGKAELVRQMEERVFGIVGQTAMPAARREVLGWLPQK